MGIYPTKGREKILSDIQQHRTKKKSQIKRKLGAKLVSELQATVLGKGKGSYQSGKYKLETEYVFISDTELIFKP